MSSEGVLLRTVSSKTTKSATDLITHVKSIAVALSQVSSRQEKKFNLVESTRKILSCFSELQNSLLYLNPEKAPSLSNELKENVSLLKKTVVTAKELLILAIKLADSKIDSESGDSDEKFDECMKKVFDELKRIVILNRYISNDADKYSKSEESEQTNVHADEGIVVEGKTSANDSDVNRGPFQSFTYSRSVYFSGTAHGRKKSFSPVVADSSKYVVEHHGVTFESPALQVVEDLYAKKFFPSSHYNFIGSHMDDTNTQSKCTCVISVLKTPALRCPDIRNILDLGSGYHSMVTDKSGQREFDITSLILTSSHVKQGIEEFLNTRAQRNMSYYAVENADFPNDLLQVEDRHPRKITQMKVAVLYVKPGQTDLMEIFANQPPSNSPFFMWLDTLAEKITLHNWKKYRGDIGANSKQTSYYTVWKGIEIMFHITPWMIAEQHRRLIGNDICFIVYYDNNSRGEHESLSFNTAPMDTLGTVPQVFCVVQPYQKLFRLGFFNRTNLKPFSPPSPPRDYLFDATDLKDYLLTKLHNGFLMARSCPPLSRLYTTPRGATLKELGDKYPRLSKKEIAKREQLEEKKLKEHQQESDAVENLVVRVQSGRNLKACDSNGFSDPYCILKLGSQVKKISVIRKNLNPEWNAEVVYNLLGMSKESLDINITVMDWDRFSSDDYMGEINLRLVDAITAKVSQWYPLISTTADRVCGEILVSFQYVAGPMPGFKLNE